MNNNSDGGGYFGVGGSGVDGARQAMEQRRRGNSKDKGGIVVVDEDTRHCERVESEIVGRFGVVTGGIAKLSNVFSGAAEILETRARAITTISRCVQLRSASTSIRLNRK